MTTYTFELPEAYDVHAGGAKVTVKVADLSHDIIAKLVLHGLRQKVADAAASAKKLSEADDETRDKATLAGDLMSKVVTNLEAGNWGVERTGGATADPLDRFILDVMRQIINLPANAKAKATHDAMKTEDGKADNARRKEYLLKKGRASEAVMAEANRRKDTASALDVEL